MPYVQFWDVIEDQLWSFQDQNILKANLDYLAQTCFGITDDDDSGVAAWLKFEVGAGMIFDNDPTKYLKPNGGATALELDGLDLKTSTQNVIRGQQFSIYTKRVIADTDSIFSTSGSKTLTLGYKMPRPGSILSIEYAIDVISFVGAGTVAYKGRIYKNGSFMVAGASTGNVASTTTYRTSDSFTRGAQVFAADDLLEIQHEATVGGLGGAISAVASAVIHGIMDT